MRTTVRIDDDLMHELKERAHREGTSLTRLLNRLLRAGLRAARRPRTRKRRHREQTHSMGAPSVDLDKALAVAALMEDEEVRRKMRLRK